MKNFYTLSFYSRFLFLIGLTLCVTGCASIGAKSADPWLSVDKMVHFGTSAALAAAITQYGESAKSNKVSTCDAPLVGFSVTLGIGASKELYDKHIKKTLWSWKDMTWNALGAGLGSLAASDCKGVRW